MPTPNPPKADITIDDDTPGDAVVYIVNPSDKSVGTCTVNQYRDLYRDRGYGLTTPEAYAAHQEALRQELSSLPPDLFIADGGKTVAQKATARTTES